MDLLDGPDSKYLDRLLETMEETKQTEPTAKGVCTESTAVTSVNCSTVSNLTISENLGTETSNGLQKPGPSPKEGNIQFHAHNMEQEVHSKAPKSYDFASFMDKGVRI